jgi:hypothetical protein
MLCSSLLAQDLVEQIIERNPFDPQRGKVDAIVEEEVEEEAPPTNLPLLDATILFPGNPVAIFSFREEGEEKTEAVFLNGKVAGFQLVAVQTTSVLLRGGGQEHQIVLFQQEGKKSRGGSKQKVQGNTPKTNASNGGEKPKETPRQRIRRPVASRPAPKSVEKAPTTPVVKPKTPLPF